MDQGESAFSPKDLGITSKIYPQSKPSSLPECNPHYFQPNLHPTMASLGQEVANPSSSGSQELAPTMDQFGNTANDDFDFNIDLYSDNSINKVIAKLDSSNTPEISNDHENIGSPEIISVSRNKELNPHDEEMLYSEDTEYQNDIPELLFEDSSNSDLINIYTAPSPVSRAHSDEELDVIFNDLIQGAGNDPFDGDLIPSPSTMVSPHDIFDRNPNDRNQNNQSMYADHNVKQYQYVSEYPKIELNLYDITFNEAIREDNNVSSIQYEQTPINNIEIDQGQQFKAVNQLDNENEINQNKTSILCISDPVDPTSNEQIEIIVDEALDCIVPQKKPISMGFQSQTCEFSDPNLPSVSAQEIVMVPKCESINPQAYQNDAPASWNSVPSSSNNCASSLSDSTSNPETGPCSVDNDDNDASTSGECGRQPRKSLKGMSYEQRYFRLRKQNNKSSKKCREKNKMEKEKLFQKVETLERRVEKLELENKKLLDRLRGKW